MDFKNSMASQAASPDIGISKSHMFSWLKLLLMLFLELIDCGVPANCQEAKKSALCLEKKIESKHPFNSSKAVSRKMHGV